MSNAVSRFFSGVFAAARQHSPQILTGIGVGGLIVAGVLAVKATPAAMQKIEERKQQEGTTQLTKKQTVQAAWKCYIPAVTTGTVSVASIIIANVITHKRGMVMATACQLAENALREYHEKVVETIGERRETELHDSLNTEKITREQEQSPMPLMPEAPSGKILCYDAYFGLKFFSTENDIQRAVNNLNHRMTFCNEPYVSYNDFRSELELNETQIGNFVGWNSNRLIEVRFTYVTEKYSGQKVLVFDYYSNPSSDYKKF